MAPAYVASYTLGDRWRAGNPGSKPRPSYVKPEAVAASDWCCVHEPEHWVLVFHLTERPGASVLTATERSETVPRLPLNTWASAAMTIALR